ncbi:hypothetical protein Tco_0499723 [Tanacetum coccineum]
MAEESGAANSSVGVKFDMPNHESKMTAKDVKNLVRKYNVLLDLHPCAPMEGWTMNQLPNDLIGLYEQFFEFSGLRVPFSTFLLGDVRSLLERIIDLCPVPTGLLFTCGLATTWDFPGFFPVFKDTRGNAVTMSEYLHFPFLSGASIDKGAVIPPNNPIGQNTTPPLAADQSISDKNDSQIEVKVEDPNVIVAREKKKAQMAWAAAKKKDNRKRANDEGGNSKARLPWVTSGMLTKDQMFRIEKIARLPLLPVVRQLIHPLKEPVFASERNAGESSRPTNNLSTSNHASQLRDILTGRNVDEAESSQSAFVYVPK